MPKLPPKSSRIIPIRKLEIALSFIIGAFIAQCIFTTIRFHTTSSSSSSSHVINKPLYGSNNAVAKIKRTRRKGRRPRKTRNWDPGLDGLGGDPVELKVNTPIFVASLPKSGTTSIWQYFNCGGHKASHQWVKLNETYMVQTGECVARNLVQNQPPFMNCGDYDVFTDTGYALYKLPLGSSCFYPSVDALDQIYEHYPNATFILIVRDTQQWYQSMATWGEGSLLTRWRPCNTTNLPGFSGTPKDFMDFYDWHNQNIRDFVASRPSLTYIELELESDTVGATLEEQVGIPAKCWAKCTPSSKFCK